MNYEMYIKEGQRLKILLKLKKLTKGEGLSKRENFEWIHFLHFLLEYIFYIFFSSILHLNGHKGNPRT